MRQGSAIWDRTCPRGRASVGAGMVAAVATMPGLRPLGFGEILMSGLGSACATGGEGHVRRVAGAAAQIVSRGAAPRGVRRVTRTAQQPIDTGEETRFLAPRASAACRARSTSSPRRRASRRSPTPTWAREPTAKRSPAWPRRAAAARALRPHLPDLRGRSWRAGRPRRAARPGGARPLSCSSPRRSTWASCCRCRRPRCCSRTSGRCGRCGARFELVRGSWWRVLGILFVGVLLVSVLAGILQGLPTLIPAALAGGNEVCWRSPP